MKAVSLLFAGLILCQHLAAAGPDDPIEAILSHWGDRWSTAKAIQQAPQLDPKRIINASNAFLKEREPEMTAEEYAVYQKMTSILSGNPELAIKFLEGMLNEKEPPSPAFDFILGNAYYAAGQPAKAETHYRSGLKRYPTFLRAWQNLGVLYYTRERYPDAIACFNEAINLGDHDAMTYGLLGYCLEKTDNLVVAEMAYMQALEGAPTNTDWQLGLLRIYIGGKQYRRAETLARALIKEHPDEARYWLTYANILLADQRKPAAIAVLEIAAAHGSVGPDELTVLGDLYAEQQLVPEALATYQRLQAVAPADGGRRLLHLAHALTAAGNLEAAAKVVAALPMPAAAEETIAWRQTRAELLIAQKQWPAARDELDAALRLAPNNGHLLLRLGDVYLGENDAVRAAMAFESAARMSATTYEASLNLANLELKNRNYAKAIEYLEKAYRIDKTDAVADLLAQVRALAASTN